MKKYFAVFYAIAAIAAPSALGAETVDWSPCVDDIKKFECQTAENDHDKYRCLTKHDSGLSKECYVVTTEYERAMGMK